MLKKKKEQTSEQSFDNASINIRMPEMNSMIHSNIQESGWETAQK